MKWTISCGIGRGLFFAASPQSSTHMIDFNTDSRSLLNFGGSLWDGVTTSHTGSAACVKSVGTGPIGGCTNGPVTGVAGDGYLPRTFVNPHCTNSPRFVTTFLCVGVLVDDFDNGLVGGGFTFECDMRIGNGNPDPADGFRIN